jgi:hypothetical protein
VELDSAVIEAYEWPEVMDPVNILKSLLLLNSERSGSGGGTGASG